MNLESVLSDSVEHNGSKRVVLAPHRNGSSVNLNFEVADTKRAIQSVHKGRGNGSMIVFPSDGKG